MKRITLLSAGCLLALATACAPEAETLKTGDLVFVGIPADYTLDPDSMDSAIADATGDAAGLNLIHTAILDLTDGEPWIIDATIRRGVDRHPLDTFLRDFTLRDGSLPVFEIKRLRDDARAEEFVANARQYLGLPYDSTFLPDNDAFYCTELVYCSQRRVPPVLEAAFRPAGAGHSAGRPRHQSAGDGRGNDPPERRCAAAR